MNPLPLAILHGSVSPSVLVEHGWATAGDTLLVAAVILFIYPIADFFITRRIRTAKHPRKLSYGWIICSEWILTAAIVTTLWRHGMPLAAVGQTRGRLGATSAIAAAAIILFAILSVHTRRRISRLSPEKLSRTLKRVDVLIPRSPAETILFVLVAVTAGVCEELIYRGWLMLLLQTWTGHLWAAVLVSALAFGLAHAYQGISGVYSAGVLGLMFSIPVLLTHSLVPSQVIHAALDLHNGMSLSALAQRNTASQTAANA